MFACPFYAKKCGSSSNKIEMTDSEQWIETDLLEIGDVCVFEINYDKVDYNYKLWVTKSKNMEITIVDGFSKHPYLVNNGTMTFISKLLKEGDEFEVGDAWYNLTYGGKAYLFLKST